LDSIVHVITPTVPVFLLLKFGVGTEVGPDGVESPIVYSGLIYFCPESTGFREKMTFSTNKHALITLLNEAFPNSVAKAIEGGDLDEVKEKVKGVLGEVGVAKEKKVRLLLGKSDVSASGSGTSAGSSGSSESTVKRKPFGAFALPGM
jgi:hypothetical protein